MHKPNSEFSIAGKKVGLKHPTYFIADIAANHDGDLSRAKDLINLAKEAGANAAKFQHFQAETIVSDVGFNTMDKAKMSHQSGWKKSVFEVYKDASVSREWTPMLRDSCDKAGITFLTTPYDYDLVDTIDPYVPAYKIGSGDVTWPQYIRYVARKNKPMILSCGAATMDDTHRAVMAVLSVNPNVALLQCNTNYTGNIENFKYIQLNVLKSLRAMYQGMVLGLSDHTPGHVAVLGAVALGGRVIEKHFTDNTKRVGPDHRFSLDPRTWRDMVDRTRELEYALGDGVKKIEENEKDTVVLQRRALRAARDLAAGTILTEKDMVALRPCPLDGFPPYMSDALIGKKLRHAVKSGNHLRWTDLK